MTTRRLLNAICLLSLSTTLALAGCGVSETRTARVLPIDRDIDGNVIERVAGAEGEDADGEVTAARGGRAAGGASGGGLFGDDSGAGDAPDAVSESAALPALDSAGPGAPPAPARPGIDADADEWLADGEEAEPPAGFDETLDAGRLTAGALDDLADTEPFKKFAVGLAGADDTSLAALMTGDTFALRVTGETGIPLGNASVFVSMQGDDERQLALTTRTDGTAVVSTRWDELESDEDLIVTVTLPRGASRTVTIDPENSATHTIRMPGVITQPRIETIDIAILMDCTGSMGDELEYLKIELRSISQTLAEQHPGVEQRFALVAYRDADDAYTTRTFDFAGMLDFFVEDLGNQSAGGGGDYPEAVHRAFAEAVELDWTEGSAARVAIFVADAPPHPDQMTPTLKRVDTLREMGVVVIPVASSGVGDEAQLIMRSAALLTGGEHVFLTDDSGIGNAHAEPEETAGYTVMPLRDQLLRLLSAEIAGPRLPAEGDRVIRRVPPSGE